MSDERLLTLPDEKLEDYLRIWNRLIEQGQKHMLDITLTIDYTWPSLQSYTLRYGEEKRELTYEQAVWVRDWLHSVGG